MNNSIQTIKEVLHMEAEGILELEKNINDDYSMFVDMCLECEGKVVLTGMGKSGHIARKISATMASLGIPSFFLHPAEAAHGDLGMVQKKDVVIMISKSGETEELLQLINSFKIIGCKLTGIFCKEQSSLEKYCVHTLVLPVKNEACINNLAPTISTTVTLALGDALAVTLSKIKGFKDANFALFHPRGTLGKRLLTTAETLTKLKKEEVSVSKDDTVEKVLWVITHNHLGAAAVIDENDRIVGLVTDGDIRRNLNKQENILKCAVSDIMIRTPISVECSMLAIDIFQLMQEKKISVVPVVDSENILTGMISMHDIVSLGIGF